jgi:hypothetical protein
MDNLSDLMREWFGAPRPGTPLSFDSLLLRLLLALVLGCVIGAVYRFTQRKEVPAASSFITTLVLLCILLAMLTQVVGESATLAFSLVGILSIVRFRTIVEDTRDTAYVIFAVIVGMAAGVDNKMVAVTGLVVVSAAAVAMRFVPIGAARAEGDWMLNLRIGAGASAGTPWDAILARLCDDMQLVGTATARQGAALDLTYKLRLKPGVAPMQLLNEINRIEGVQNLEMKRNP